MLQSLICSTEGVKEIQTLLTSIYVNFRLQSICLFLSKFKICEGMFLLVNNLQKVVVIRRMVFLQIFVVFRALAQLFCLRFTIEILCHFFQLGDCQNSLALPAVCPFSCQSPEKKTTLLWISTNIFQTR